MIRNLIVIGEAVKTLSADLRDNCAERGGDERECSRSPATPGQQSQRRPGLGMVCRADIGDGLSMEF